MDRVAALTSGPVALFLALDRGPTFAAAAAHASLAGCLAISAYSLAYARLAERGWLVALAVAAGGWLVGAGLAEAAATWLVPGTLALVVAATAGALALMPAQAPRPSTAPAGPADIVVRMGVAVFVVVGVTELAPFVGPTVSGLLAMLPIIGTILAVFAQRSGGPLDGSSVQRGILSGLFGTAAFLAVVAWAVTPLGVAPAFLAATTTVVAVQLSPSWRSPGRDVPSRRQLPKPRRRSRPEEGRRPVHDTPPTRGSAPGR